MSDCFLNSCVMESCEPVGIEPCVVTMRPSVLSLWIIGDSSTYTDCCYYCSIEVVGRTTSFACTTIGKFVIYSSRFLWEVLFTSILRAEFPRPICVFFEDCAKFETLSFRWEWPSCWIFLCDSPSFAIFILEGFFFGSFLGVLGEGLIGVVE